MKADDSIESRLQDLNIDYEMPVKSPLKNDHLTLGAEVNVSERTIAFDRERPYGESRLQNVVTAENGQKR